jgi:hypothetical protein
MTFLVEKARITQAFFVLRLTRSCVDLANRNTKLSKLTKSKKTRLHVLLTTYLQTHTEKVKPRAIKTKLRITTLTKF